MKVLAEIDRGEGEEQVTATAAPFGGLGSIKDMLGKGIKDKVFIKNFDLAVQNKNNVMSQIDPNAPFDI